MDLIKKLQDVLDKSVESGEECGCQLSVYRYGEPVCDLFSGYTTSDKTKEVDDKTLFPVFSVGKGICTTVMMILKDQGKLDFNDFVTDYWEEYGINGKEKTTIRDVLSHRAGVWKTPDISLQDRYTWETVCKAMENAIPEDTIGGMHHYHGYTYGVLTGRIAELADGRPFPQIVQEEIVEPLGLDGMFFGINKEQFENDVAFIDGSANMMNDERLSHNEFCVLNGLNPSSNGCCNARSLAKMYSSLIGSGMDGIRLVSEKTIEEATVLCRIPEDNDYDQWDKFGHGYALCGPKGNFGRMFGQGGACGSEGFADKETGYAIGFTKNKLNGTHPDHPTRNEISKVLGLPIRIW